MVIASKTAQATSITATTSLSISSLLLSTSTSPTGEQGDRDTGTKEQKKYYTSTPWDVNIWGFNRENKAEQTSTAVPIHT